MRHIAWILIAVTVAIVGCSENKAATSACKSEQNGMRCDGCCKKYGATGVLVQGICSCRGG